MVAAVAIQFYLHRFLFLSWRYTHFKLVINGVPAEVFLVLPLVPPIPQGLVRSQAGFMAKEQPQAWGLCLRTFRNF